MIDAIVGFDRVASWAAARQARSGRAGPSAACGSGAQRGPGVGGVAVRARRGRGRAEAGPRDRGRAGRHRLPAAAVLPATHALWEAGLIDTAKARAVDEATTVLPDELAAAVQARVLGRAPEQSLAQLRAALARAILAVDPRRGGPAAPGGAEGPAGVGAARARRDGVAVGAAHRLRRRRGLPVAHQVGPRAGQGRPAHDGRPAGGPARRAAQRPAGARRGVGRPRPDETRRPPRRGARALDGAAPGGESSRQRNSGQRSPGQRGPAARPAAPAARPVRAVGCGCGRSHRASRWSRSS